MHKILFTNSSFNNNIEGGDGTTIHFNFNIAQYDYINNIRTSIFSNNSGYKSLIYSSSYDPSVQLIVKGSIFMNNG